MSGEIAMPTPTVERIPKTVDGSTWYAHVIRPGDGERVGATGRTKTRTLENLADQWRRFSETTATTAREVWS